MASQSIALLSLSIVLSSYYLLAPAPLIADSYRIGGPRLPLATSLTHGFLDLMRLACPATFNSFLTIHLSSLRGPEWDAIDTPGYMRFRVLPWALGFNISISLFLEVEYCTAEILSLACAVDLISLDVLSKTEGVPLIVLEDHSFEVGVGFSRLILGFFSNPVFLSFNLTWMQKAPRLLPNSDSGWIHAGKPL
jgi:hypothetical protein